MLSSVWDVGYASEACDYRIVQKELRIDLLRPDQVFQLFQARKSPALKDIFRHVSPPE